jgi:hypothetical protein
MREIRLLARRCRLSTGDLVGLSRDAAACGSVAGPDDLTADQQERLLAVLRLMAEPARVEDYYSSVA